ncbi:unnamed protein product [Gongylonema pulchrum]|uniref:THUMP domain-containing protein n=1 Tax=Gongylonema pulchrum TaxID=637853 RepID=A0A183ERX9_9BILA|nr:unnamed protein product [Gongylonema pulchrum]
MRCARRLLSFAVTTHAIGFCDALNKIRSQIYVSVTMISKEIILPVLIVPPKSVSRIIGCTAIANRTVARFCNKIKPVINMPSGDEKGIVFCPEKIDNEARVSVLKIVDDITDSSVRFDSYSLTMHYDDWPVKSCISAILPKGLEFGLVSHYLKVINGWNTKRLIIRRCSVGQFPFFSSFLTLFAPPLISISSHPSCKSVI